MWERGGGALTVQSQRSLPSSCEIDTRQLTVNHAYSKIRHAQRLKLDTLVYIILAPVFATFFMDKNECFGKTEPQK